MVSRQDSASMIADQCDSTRRAMLQGVLVAALAATFTARAEAQQKASQKMVNYQQTPKGDQECDKCLHFVPPDSCKMVEGKINPKGWCSLFAPKPK
jgi:hypothetical protein